MPYLSPFRCPKVLFGPFRWQKSFSVFSRTGPQAYNSASKLDIIQNHALRIATRAYYSTPINALEVECGIKPLHLRREEIILKYWARSSPLGQALPMNNLVTGHGCHTTKRALKFNPYSVTIRKL